MNKTGKKIAIFGNVYQIEKSASISRIISILNDRNAELQMEKSFYDFLSSQNVKLPNIKVFNNDDFVADFVISIGGDGTFLNAASHVGDKNIPILGINTGHLGFLSTSEQRDAERDLEMLFSEEYNVEEHSLIYVSGNGLPLTDYPYALNEVAILKRDNASMISIKTSINGEYLTTYQSDGLIVSTPTGSTAYSLSAGGPIMIPQSSVLSLVAVAPHSLNIRPVVITDDAVITLKVESRNDTFLVGIDGRSVKCDENTELTIRKAPYTIKVVRSKEKNFFTTLRKKLLWGVRTDE